MSLIKNHSKQLDILRVIGCIGVVSIHVTGYQKDLLVGSVYYFINQVLRSPAVAIFFFISGLLVSSNLKGELVYKDFIFRKAKRILIPYVAVSLSVGLCRYFLEFTGFYSLNTAIADPLHYRLTIGILFSTTVPHLYFLISLFLLFLIFHFIRPLLRTPKNSLFALLFYASIGFKLLEWLYSISGIQLPTEPDVPRSTIRGAIYFLTGIVWFHYGDSIMPYLKKYGKLLAINFMIGAAFSKYMDFYLWNAIPVCTILMLLAYISFTVNISNYVSKYITMIASLTYGIYLLHMPIFVNIGNRIIRVLIDNSYFINVATIIRLYPEFPNSKQPLKSYKYCH